MIIIDKLYYIGPTCEGKYGSCPNYKHYNNDLYLLI